MHVVCFVGLPGSGKSTQIRLLRGVVACVVIHVVKAGGVLFLEVDGVRSVIGVAGQVGVGEVTAAVLGAGSRADADLVVLDGVPRSVVQARDLVLAAGCFGWWLSAVFLVVDGGVSLVRQRERGRLGEDESFMLRKLARAVDGDVAAVGELVRLGVRVQVLDGLCSVGDVHAGVLDAVLGGS